MARHDGKVTLSTKIDTTGIKTGVKSIKTVMKSAGKALLAVGTAAAAATGAVVKQSVDAYAEFEQLTGGVETLFKGSADKVKKYAEEAYRTAGLSANEYMSTVTSFSASLISSLGGDTDKAADVANTALIDMSDNANKMGTELESVQAAYQGFAKQQYTLLDNLKLGYGGTKTEMERLLKEAEAYSGVKYDINNLADVYEAIHQIQDKLDITGTTAKEAEKTISGSAAMMKASWQNVLTAMAGGGVLNNAIEDLVFSIEKYMNNILPVVERSLVGIGYAIEKLAPMIVERIAVAIIKAIPSLLNAVYKMIISLAKGIYQGVKALFAGGTAEVLEQQAESIAASVENQKSLTEEVEETGKAAKKTFAGFDEIQTLNSGDGSAATEDMDISSVGASEASADGDDSAITGKIEKNLAIIMTVAGAALAAVGLILLFSGNVLWGVGYIIAGAAMFGVGAASLSEEAVDQTVTSALTTIMGAVAGALVAIGVILIMVGSTALGIGFIAAGAALLGVTVYAISEFSTDPIKDTLLMIEAIAGGAMLALGILLLYFGVNKPLAIGLIVAGAAILAVAVAQIVAGAVSKEVAAWIYGITAIVSGALLVLGIILLFVPGAQGLGLGLLIAGAAGLATVVAFNWNSIINSIKGVWQKIKDFWNKNIAQIFTAKFWLDLAKKCGNGLISGFEGSINGIISMFESMINWVVSGLNKIGFDIPDWVPEIGGKRFGFNIPKVKFNRVSIPRLAQGAVIPPNREFMAVLGDQKHGTNIEAPLETIKQALAEVMATQGSGDITINFTGDLAQLARVLKPVIDRENIRVGGSMIRKAGT